MCPSFCWFRHVKTKPNTHQWCHTEKTLVSRADSIPFPGRQCIFYILPYIFNGLALPLSGVMKYLSHMWESPTLLSITGVESETCTKGENARATITGGERSGGLDKTLFLLLVNIKCGFINLNNSSTNAHPVFTHIHKHTLVLTTK